MRASFLEKVLYGIHKGLAKATDIPELQLEKEEAKRLGEGVAAVLAFHKIKMTAKQEAYSALGEAMAEVYPPMIVAAIARKKLEADRAAKNAPPKPAAPVAAPVQPPIAPQGFDATRIVMPPG